MNLKMLSVKLQPFRVGHHMLIVAKTKWTLFFLKWNVNENTKVLQNEINLKRSSANWRPRCLSLNAWTYRSRKWVASTWQMAFWNEFLHLGAVWLKCSFYILKTKSEIVVCKMVALLFPPNVLTHCCRDFNFTDYIWRSIDRVRWNLNTNTTFVLKNDVYYSLAKWRPHCLCLNIDLYFSNNIFTLFSTLDGISIK